MKLSVIIVNYNVQHFLEQCLFSVREAAKNLDAEIYVVDNNSVDGSVEMIKEKFPEVKLIANKENVGFSRANNQAIQQSSGEYVLLLNPDTVVEDDTFIKVVSFMDEHPDAGGVGIQMVDGKGKFLPESKRGLPTPEVAFYKIFGLARLFPKSRRFGKYHLGYLDKNKTHEVEVLSGAFMMLRREALEKVGLLDEEFFMYGEDIDLSYRITQGGYKNYYFPDARIIHYKGESTKKSSVNFVLVFYNAMVIFARKHFSAQNARTFSFLINFAIYLRAGAAILARFLKKIFVPLLDAAAIYGGVYLLANYWEANIKAAEGVHYPVEFFTIVVPLYILIWLISVFFSGGYDKPVNLVRIVRGLLIGTGIILIIYALLPETVRFSRALILIGAFWSILATFGIRVLLRALNIKGYDWDEAASKRVAIVGNEAEAKRVEVLLNQTSVHPAFTGFVYPTEQGDESNGDYLGNVKQLSEIIEIYKINEVIFCAKDLPAQRIIDNMSYSVNGSVDFKIAPPESLYIIGSNSIDTSGDLYVIDINSIGKTKNRRNKRVLDILMSLVLLAASPVLMFFQSSPLRYLKNCIQVLIGKKSWVGYNRKGSTTLPSQVTRFSKLPDIKSGVLNPVDALSNKNVNQATSQKLNMLYSKDYKVSNDLNIIWKGFRELGR